MAACGALFALTFILQQARKSFLPSTPVEILHAPQVASPKIMEEEEPVF